MFVLYRDSGTALPEPSESRGLRCFDHRGPEPRPLRGRSGEDVRGVLRPGQLALSPMAGEKAAQKSFFGEQ